MITGAWSAGDLHVHTIQSDDAQTTLETVLDQAFNRYKLDWAALSNHLRMSKRDHTGLDIPGGPVPFSTGMARYEAPFIQQAQAAGRYAGKIIFSSFEWDMPTHDHVNIGIGVNEPMSAKSLRAVAEFEYLYTNKAANLFDPQLVADLAGQPRAYSTHADSLAALKWLRDKHPDSYMLLNHPSRYAGKYTIGQLREMHDLAPSIFFAIEGMVGNQMEPDRGGYAEPTRPPSCPTAPTAASTIWSRSWAAPGTRCSARTPHLDRGRFGFPLPRQRHRPVQQRLRPGEYARTYVWKDGKDMAAVVAGLKSGRMYGVFGDLIDALEFQAQGASGTAQMGAELIAAKGEQVEVTIRFRSPDSNHYEYPIESGNPTYVKPTVHHVDLIVGDVGPRAAPGTPAYDQATNPSTRVLGRYARRLDRGQGRLQRHQGQAQRRQEPVPAPARHQPGAGRGRRNRQWRAAAGRQDRPDRQRGALQRHQRAQLQRPVVLLEPGVRDGQAVDAAGRATARPASRPAPPPACPRRPWKTAAADGSSRCWHARRRC